MRTPNALLVPAALLLAGLACLPGLWGPFLLDDYPNLEPLRLWLEGIIAWQGVVFGNDSGPLGRPLSMASFLLNAAAGDMQPWHFKAVNLVIHLACGILIAGFANRLFRLDEQMKARAAWLALVLAIWWLLLPIHTATVFYVVQRMAQLSALFIFAGLWLYLAARERIENGHRSGAWMLFAGIPALSAAGALAKENALLLPLLCGVLELVMYRGRWRPRSINWFLILLVGLPVMAGLVMVLWQPQAIPGSFKGRDFTLGERLLTQGRVLWDYVQQILIPAGTGLSLFQDDTTVSRSLLQPVTTLAAIIAWTGVLATAWAARRVAPLIPAGVLLFLVGHLMESSVFPLELAFLHRNYMPSIGILVAVIGAAGFVGSRLPPPSPEFRRIGLAALVLAGAVLWAATHARAWVWQSETSLIAYELENNPDSVRGRLMAATHAIGAGNTGAAMDQIQRAENSLPDRERGAASIWRMAAFCGTSQPIPDNLIREFRSSAGPAIGRFEREAFGTLTSHLERKTCPLDNLEAVARAAEHWLDTTAQPGRAMNVWRFRYNTARLLARSGKIEAAFPHAARAFDDSGHEFPVGVFAFQLAVSLDKSSESNRILDRLKAVEDPNDRRHRQTIEQFEVYLKSQESG